MFSNEYINLIDKNNCMKNNKGNYISQKTF
jgi:hypothetical protein